MKNTKLRKLFCLLLAIVFSCHGLLPVSVFAEGETGVNEETTSSDIDVVYVVVPTSSEGSDQTEELSAGTVSGTEGAQNTSDGSDSLADTTSSESVSESAPAQTAGNDQVNDAASNLTDTATTETVVESAPAQTAGNDQVNDTTSNPTDTTTTETVVESAPAQTAGNDQVNDTSSNTTDTTTTETVVESAPAQTAGNDQVNNTTSNPTDTTTTETVVESAPAQTAGNDQVNDTTSNPTDNTTTATGTESASNQSASSEQVSGNSSNPTNTSATGSGSQQTTDQSISDEDQNNNEKNPLPSSDASGSNATTDQTAGKDSSTGDEENQSISADNNTSSDSNVAQTEGEGTDQEGTQTEGEGTDQEGTQSEGEGTDPEGTQTEGEGTDQEGTQTEGEGTDPEGTQTEGEGTDQEGTQTEGEGTDQEGTQTEGEGTDQEGTQTEGEGTDQEGTQTEGEGTDQEGTQTEGEGTDQEGTQTEGEETDQGDSQTEGENTNIEDNGEIEENSTEQATLLRAPLSVPATSDNNAEETDNADLEPQNTDGDDSTTDENQTVPLITDRPPQSDEITNVPMSPDDINNLILPLTEGFDYFIDKEDGSYKITFTIAEGTDAEELVIDLTRALTALTTYGQVTSSNVLQPGDSRVFKIFIRTESGHTYRYKDGSFILTTPEMNQNEIPEDPENQFVGFDGQVLEKRYIGKKETRVFYCWPCFHDYLINELGFPAGDVEGGHIWRGDIPGILKKLREKYHQDDDQSAIMQHMLAFYNEKDSANYSSFDDMIRNSPTVSRDMQKTDDWTELGVTIPLAPADLYDDFYDFILRVVYGDEDVNQATGERKGVTETIKTVYDIVDADDGQTYYGCFPANSTKESWKFWDNYCWWLPEDILVQPLSDGGYNYAFGYIDENGVRRNQTASQYDGIARNYVTHEAIYENSHWADSTYDDIKNATVHEYMKQENSEIWAKANEYFRSLLKNGLSATEANELTEKMVQFSMGINIDYLLAGNNYQNTQWGWNNTIGLERVDGELNLEKIDKETNELISDNETKLQIWYYKDTNSDERYDEEDDKYYWTVKSSQLH